jgi:catechol 2,3-dioxygenase-like lactoylglutathione lyase family enzyme
MTILPGPIRQVGYVVTDLDAALASWVNLDVGPWFVMRGMQLRALYRGEPCEVTLSLALANSGEMQFELIYQHDDTPSIYTEFLESQGPGFHQLAYWAADYDATLASIRDAAWPVVWSGGEDLGARFAYVEPPNGPTHISQIIEIMELTDVTDGMAQYVREIAASWDGSDPIRVLSA